MSKLSVLYNAYTLSKPITGVGRYTQLVSNINSDYIDKYASLPNDKVLWDHSFNEIYNKNYTSLLGKLFWNFFDIYPKGLDFNLYHSTYPSLPYNLKSPSIVTVHDVLFLSNPEWYPKVERKILYLSLINSIRRADKIICVSEYTRKMLIKFFPYVRHKCFLIYNSLPQKNVISQFTKYSNYKTDNSKISEFIKSGIPFFICPSNRHPRKNLINTINGFMLSKFKDKGYKLVLTGLSENFSSISDESLEDVYDFGYLSDDDYYYLIKRSSGILYFPFNEGFGLPILDALLFDKIILCSEIPVFLEIVSNPMFLCKDIYSPLGVANFLNFIYDSNFIVDDFLSDILNIKCNFSFNIFESSHLELYSSLLPK